jgi:hypothetical protein
LALRRRRSMAEREAKVTRLCRNGERKGNKIRNKDPYGCHTSPDEMLNGSTVATGAVVMAGKYGKKGYTRPTSYAGPKTIVEFEKRDTVEKKQAN